MPDYKVTESQLTSIANAIRAKVGGGDPIEFPTEFVSKINSITATLKSTTKSYSAFPGSRPIPQQSSLQISFTPGDGFGGVTSVSMTPSFTGRNSLRTYCSIGTSSYSVIIYNPTATSITIPNGTEVRITYKVYSASL